jgi:hypothetical protein
LRLFHKSSRSPRKKGWRTFPSADLVASEKRPQPGGQNAGAAIPMRQAAGVAHKKQRRKSAPVPRGEILA